MGGAAPPAARPRRPGLGVREEGASPEKRDPGPRPPPGPGVSKASGPPHCPCLSLTFRARRAASSNAGGGRFSRSARTRTLSTAGRAQTTHQGPEPLARSLARTRGSCAPTSAASRGRRPAALHTPRGALSRSSRSPSSTSTVVLVPLEGCHLQTAPHSGRSLWDCGTAWIQHHCVKS